MLSFRGLVLRFSIRYGLDINIKFRYPVVIDGKDFDTFVIRENGVGDLVLQIFNSTGKWNVRYEFATGDDLNGEFKISQYGKEIILQELLVQEWKKNLKN